MCFDLILFIHSPQLTASAVMPLLWLDPTVGNRDRVWPPFLAHLSKRMQKTGKVNYKNDRVMPRWDINH